MRRVLAPLLAASLIVLTPSVADAGSSAKKDPNDTESRLDVKRVALKSQGKKIVATITTWDAYSDADLLGGASLGIDFKVSKKKVRGVAVRATGGGLTANVCSYTPNGPVTGTACSKAGVKRLSDTSMQFTVPRAKIDRGAKILLWRGSSLTFDGTAGCTTSPFCLDTMAGPNKWFKLRA